MADWKDKLPEAAQEYLEGRRLDEVECIISDLPGIARGKAVPAVPGAETAPPLPPGLGPPRRF